MSVINTRRSREHEDITTDILENIQQKIPIHPAALGSLNQTKIPYIAGRKSPSSVLWLGMQWNVNSAAIFPSAQNDKPKCFCQ